MSPRNAHPSGCYAGEHSAEAAMLPPNSQLKFTDLASLFVADIQLGLQYIFQTDSKYVLLVSGSGHAGMEAVIANMLEAGETIVVGNHGIWGERVIDLADRYGGR